MASEFKKYILEDFDLSDCMLLETFASLGEVLESTALSTYVDKDGKPDEKAKDDKYAKIKEKSKQYFEKLKEAIKKLIKKIAEKLNVFKEFAKTSYGLITIHDWDLLTKDWDKFISNVRKIPRLYNVKTEEDYNDYKEKLKETIESFTSAIKEHKEQKKTEYKLAYDLLSIKFNIITLEYNKIILPLGNDLLTQVAYNFYSLFFTDLHKIVERFGTKEGRKNSEEQLKNVKKQYDDINDIKKESTEFDFDNIMEEGTVSLTIKQKLQALVEKIKKLIAKIISKFKDNKSVFVQNDENRRLMRTKRVKVSDWDNVLRVIKNLEVNLTKLERDRLSNRINEKRAQEKAKEYFSVAHEKLMGVFDEKNLVEKSVNDAIEDLQSVQRVLQITAYHSDTFTTLVYQSLSKLGSELSKLYASLDISDIEYKRDKPEEEIEEDRANNIPKEKKNMKESILSFTMESFDLETKDDKKQGMRKKIEEKWKKLMEAIRRMIDKISKCLKSKLGMKLNDDEIRSVDWDAIQSQMKALNKTTDEAEITKICDKIDLLLSKKKVMSINEAYGNATLLEVFNEVNDITSNVTNSKVATIVNKVIAILNSELTIINKQIEDLHSKKLKDMELEESILSFTMESFDLEPKDDKKQGMRKKIEEKWKKMIEAIRRMIARITDFLKSKMGMKLKEEEIKVVNWKDVALELSNLSKKNDENDISKTCDKIEKLLKRKVIMNVNEAYAEAYFSNMATKLFDLTSGVVNSKVATVVNKVINILNEEISAIMKKIEALDSKMTKETEVEESVMEEGAIKDKLSNVAEKGKKKITMALDKTMIVAFKTKYKKLSKEELSKVEKTAKSNYAEAVKIAKKESLVVKKYESDVNKFLIIFMPDGLTMVAAKKLLAPVRKYSCELEAIKQLKNKPVKEGVEMIDDEIDYTTIIESCDITEDDILELDLESMTESELMELDGAEINRVLFEEYVDDDWFGYEFIREAFGKKDFDEDGKIIIPDLKNFQGKALEIWKASIVKMDDDKLQKNYKRIKKDLEYCNKAKEKKEARGPQKEMIHQILVQFLPLGNIVRQLMGNYDSYPPRVIGMTITMGKALDAEFKKEFKKRKLKPLAESVVEENDSVVNESTSEYDVTDDGYILLDI